MSEDISTTSSDTAEIARDAIVSKMVSPQRGIVLPDLKSRRRKYKAADVEQAFRDIAAQVDDYQTTVTQEIVQLLALLITEVHRETTTQRQVAQTEIAEMHEEIKREGALIISNAQREALSLDHKMEEIRRIAAEVSNVANSTPTS
jgi:DNA-binding transcriptional ArsR family regulator